MQPAALFFGPQKRSVRNCKESVRSMGSGDVQALGRRHLFDKVRSGMATFIKLLEWVPYTRWWEARLKRERLEWIDSLSQPASGAHGRSK